jgi:hypothetical protein
MHPCDACDLVVAQFESLKSVDVRQVIQRGKAARIEAEELALFELFEEFFVFL